MTRRAIVTGWIVLCLGSPLWSRTSFDIDFSLISRRGVLRQLKHPSAESPIDCFLPPGSPKRSITLSILGTRWAFLNEYDASGLRVWRSFPIPIKGYPPLQDRVHQPFFRPFGPDGLVLCFPSAPPSMASHWILLPGHQLISFHPSEPGSLQIWQGGDLEPDARILTTLSKIWAQTPPVTGEGKPIPFSSEGASFTPDPTTSWPDFGEAVFEAKERFQSLREKGAAKAAGAALELLEPRLASLDWEDTPGNLIPELNDLGYLLAMAGGQENTWDAELMLRHVIRMDPQRESALLNLADVLGTLAQGGNPWSRFGPQNCREQAKEYYRLFATSQLPHGFSPSMKARLLQKLEVPRLDAEQCRPQQALFRAIQDEDLDAFTRALAGRPREINHLMPNQLTALQMCIESRREDWAILLLKAGADPNRSNGTPYQKPALLSAIAQGSPILVKWLLEKGASLRPRGTHDPALVSAAYYCSSPGSLEVFKRVLEASGKEVDVVDREGDTPLLEAAGAPAPLAYLQLLLGKGADLRRTNTYGRTALHKLPPFCLEKVGPLMECLLAHGADPNAQSENGDTPLNYLWQWTRASPETQAGMTRILLKHGAKADIASRDGLAPLDRAVARGNLPAIEALLAAGADPQRAGSGKSPLQRAEDRAKKTWTYDKAGQAEAEAVLKRLRQAVHP